MAKIVLGSYVVRAPLGGYLSWVLQWMVGFDRLGHEVVFVEKAGWPNACYDPVHDRMGDDCSHGTRVWGELLGRFGLDRSWCFVDAAGRYHGLTRSAIEDRFREADIFVDMGTHGTWADEAQSAARRVLIDGEPGATQMKMEGHDAAAAAPPDYDFYFTVGRGIGSERCTAPTAGKPWRPLVYPVVVDLFPARPAPAGGCYTTIMSWQAHQPVTWNGVTYGAKDVEFAKFMDLPRRTPAPLEVAVGGKGTPAQRLRDAGWRVRDSHAVTLSFDAFVDYLVDSRGEFSVCKNVFVATRTGWFSDRSAAYLACARPVVMQETGFSDHLPTGRGLFAIETADDAARAIAKIERDWDRQSRWARELAREHLDTSRVLPRFLAELEL